MEELSIWHLLYIFFHFLFQLNQALNYVLKYTVDEYFKNHPNGYNCKVLDPACGSGIFLVETFRKLVAQYEKVTNKKADEEIIKKLKKIIFLE